MTFVEILRLMASILAGILACAPLAGLLVKYAAKLGREKNWVAGLELVMKLMGDAEELLGDGAERKKWVLEGIGSLSAAMGCETDTEAVGELIDTLCGFSKTVNAAKSEKEAEK